jgi:hypothetical protein
LKCLFDCVFDWVLCHRHIIGHKATFQLYWWRKTSGALSCIISGTNVQTTFTVSKTYSRSIIRLDRLALGSCYTRRSCEYHTYNWNRSGAIHTTTSTMYWVPGFMSLLARCSAESIQHFLLLTRSNCFNIWYRYQNKNFISRMVNTCTWHNK